jgi:hypothetical protein
MAYPARLLITRAYYLSQVVSRELQTVSGDQITDGLALLNAFLNFKGTDLRLIPYFKRFSFNTIQGQEDYFIQNLLYVDSITFNIGVVRYSMTDMTRKDYFATPRVDNIQSLPFSYRPERELDGMRLFFYFVPADVYVMKIFGKFGLTTVTLDTDLSLIYDPFFIEYLRYGLAEYICSDYGATFPDESKMKLMEIEKKLLEVSPADLSIQKKSYFTKAPFIDWQSVNIPGWWPF